MDYRKIKIVPELKLAEVYHIPSEIELLIGAAYYYGTIGIRYLRQNMSVLPNTRLG